MAQTAHDEAAAHYRRALDSLLSSGSSDPVRRCDLLLALGAARTRGGDTTGGRATYLEAAALARQRGLGDQLAAAAIGYAGMTGYHFSGRRDETLVALLEEAIAALAPPGDSEMRVRLLARLSVALYWSDLDGYRFELSEEAVAMARRLRDPGTLALAIHSRRYAQWGPDNFEQRLADGARCRTLAFEANELELAVSASRWRFTDLLEDGDVAAADRELDAYAELAQRLHQPFLLAYTTQFRALRAIMQGRFRDGAVLAEEAREQSQRAGNRLADLVHGSQMLPVWWLCRRYEELEGFLSALRSSPPHPATTSVMALIHTELGDRETAAAMLEQLAAPGLRKLRRDMLFLPGLIRLTLVSAALNDASHTEEIYDQLRPFIGRVVVVGAPVQACWGAVDHYLGVLAALGGRPDWAAEHFEAALAAGARLGAPALLAQTRLEYGGLLLNTAGADHDRGMALLSAAGRTAYSLDLKQMIERFDAVVDAAGVAGTSDRIEGHDSSAPAVGTPTCTLRREGDFWTVVTPRGSTHVRDAKGMRHLATMLAQPGRPIHVLDLAAGSPTGSGVGDVDEADSGDAGAGFILGFGDAGEVLDDAAKNAYRRRLSELEESIGEAERFNDIGRAAQLGAERDMLIEQLAQAVGLGGRDRRAVSVSERARVNVTRAIRSAIRKISELDRDAGHYLDVTVVTGTYCVFDPQRSS
jgi:hypothetical protein